MGGGGGEGGDGDLGEGVAEDAEAEVRGAEGVAPLGDAVAFINGEGADADVVVHPLQQPQRALRLFRGQIHDRVVAPHRLFGLLARGLRRERHGLDACRVGWGRVGRVERGGRSTHTHARAHAKTHARAAAN